MKIRMAKVNYFFDTLQATTHHKVHMKWSGFTRSYPQMQTFYFKYNNNCVLLEGSTQLLLFCKASHGLNCHAGAGLCGQLCFAYRWLIPSWTE